MPKRLIALFIALVLLGCSESQSTSQQSASERAAAATVSAQPASENHALLFFLDPNGGPCRIQDAILQDMREELAGKVDILYVQTTVPSDLNTFYAFGIRGLPALLLADASGKEIRRLPPGVKSAAEIRALLQAIPGN